MTIVSWETCILTVACLRWSVETSEWKSRKNIDTIFQNIIVYITSFCLTIAKSQSFLWIIDDYSFMINLYFSYSMLEVICRTGKWKSWRSVVTIFQNIIVYIATICLTITKSMSFPIIIDDYNFMINLHFVSSILETTKWKQLKDIETIF